MSMKFNQTKIVYIMAKTYTLYSYIHSSRHIDCVKVARKKVSFVEYRKQIQYWLPVIVNWKSFNYYGFYIKSISDEGYNP